MQVIENSKIKEKMYMEKLPNGLTIIMIPKRKLKKKYITWGTNFGSIDSKCFRYFNKPWSRRKRLYY